MTAAWWSTATVAELAVAGTVVDDFIREGDVPAPEDTVRFARALALQTLCARPAALADAIDAAAALTDVYRAWITKDAAPADRPDPSAWVNRSPAVRQGVELCLTMLPKHLADAVAGKVTEFSERSQALEDANSRSYFVEGTRTPFTMRTATFRKSAPS